ncbi:MAG: hypothetical protein JNJ88_01595 [Planctomycetes bacterium]|nr:hypothetical protein [Planctomycetota bacterium]
MNSLAFLGLTLLGIPSVAAQAIGPSDRDCALRAQLGVCELSRERLELHSDPDGRMRTVVHVDGEAMLLDLRPHSFRAPGFEVLLVDGVKTTKIAAPPPATFRGTLWKHGVERVGAVTAAYAAGALRGTLELDSGRRFGMQPLRDLDEFADPFEVLIHDVQDALPQPFACAAMVEGTGPQGAAPQGAPGAPQPALSLVEGEIAIDVDYEAFLTYGGTPDAVTAEVESLFNQVSAIYEQQLGVVYELKTLILRTSAADPYSATAVSDVLNELRLHWNANHNSVQRDLTFLMTGKNFGQVVGLAYVGVGCDTGFAYGLARAKFSVSDQRNVTAAAHELGHMWGSGHCDGTADCGIMCSFLGGCSGSETTFGAQALAEMNAYIATKSCLATLPGPLSLPFEESFAEAAVSSSRWTLGSGAAISTAAVAEPSGTRSANLDGGDSLGTNGMQLAGLSNHEVRYWTERRGVEAGESLRVQFLDSTETWNELEELLSDGWTQSIFFESRKTLPPSAFHNNFRLRFVAAGSAADDDWYIDDVSIVSLGAPAARFCAENISAITAYRVLGDGSTLAQSSPVASCGTAGTALPWTASNVDGATWLAFTTASGTVDGVGPEGSVGLQLSTGDLPVGVHRARARLAKSSDAAVFYDVPVTAVVAPGPSFQLGDTLTGELTSGESDDSASFVALGGTVLTLTAKVVTGSTLKLVATLLDSTGAVVKTVKVGAPTTKDIKKTIKVPSSGLFTLALTAEAGTTGLYEIVTSAKQPKLGAVNAKKSAPKVNGGPLEIPFWSVPGSSLDVAVVPTVGSLPLTLALVDPNGNVLETGVYERSYGASGICLTRMPLGMLGACKLRISGFTLKESVSVTLSVRTPTSASTVSL